MSQAGILSLADAPVPPSVPTSFLLDDSNSAVPLANVIQVTGNVGVATSLGSSNQILLTVKNDGFTWSEQNSTFSAAVQNGYFCNTTLTVNLPASAGLTIGNSVIVYVDTTNTVTIQAGAGEQIQVGGNVSGVAGTATSNTKGAILELVYKPSDTTWHTISSIGTWTVV